MALSKEDFREIRSIVEDEKYISSSLKDDTKVPVYKVRINYKSGIGESVWFLEFDVDIPLTTINYKELCVSKRPVYFNIDEIESIYQVGISFINKKELDEIK